MINQTVIRKVLEGLNLSDADSKLVFSAIKKKQDTLDKEFDASVEKLEKEFVKVTKKYKKDLENAKDTAVKKVATKVMSFFDIQSLSQGDNHTEQSPVAEEIVIASEPVLEEGKTTTSGEQDSENKRSSANENWKKVGDKIDGLSKEANDYYEG